MQGKVKLSKRQIKEDKFTTFVLTSKQQVIDNWQFMVIGVVIVALAIFAVVYYFNSRSDWQAEGSQMFARGMMEYRGGDRQVAITTFEQILDDYGSHQVAGDATYMLGSANLELRNYPEAIRYFEMYLQKYKDDKIQRAASQAGIATALENQGTYADAAEKYLEAIKELPDGPMVPLYHDGAMRNYLLLGEVEQAREQLDEIKKMAPNTEIYNRAARYFAAKAYVEQPNS